MTRKLASLLILVLLTAATAGLAVAEQKQTKEEKQSAKIEAQKAKLEDAQKKYAPAEVTIKASLGAIKTTLIREQLAAAYELADERPSQLIFKTPAVDNQSTLSRAVIGNYTTRLMQTFTFAQAEGTVTVFGTIQVVATNNAGVEETPLARFGPSKELKDRMQKYLDKLKATLESPAAVSSKPD